jgi:crotonobetainyl-CoA:carnitine CoA-transferase CaiB-like acyl-CoA transferase
MPPLDGLRVLDLSRVLAGPYCTMVLADLGADVVKIERPGTGDETRGWGPPYAGGESAYYLSVNRGKRSCAIDLSTDEGRRLALELCARADVVIENFKTGTAERMGLDRASVAARNPRVVYCSITGFGSRRRPAGRPGYDFVAQAESGIMSITGEADGLPMKVGVAIADITAGMFAAIGALAALAEARAGGAGRHVSVSLFDAQLAWLANRAADFLVAGVEPERLGNAHPAIVPYEAFPALDGHLVLAVGTDAQFGRFCAAAGLDALGADPRFASNAERVRHRLELVGELAEAIALRPLAEWVGLLAAAGVPGGPVRTIPEAFASAPFALSEQTHPLLGVLRSVRSPIALDGVRHTSSLAPPLLGQHTAEVLAEVGLEPDAIARLDLRG